MRFLHTGPTPPVLFFPLGMPRAGITMVHNHKAQVRINMCVMCGERMRRSCVSMCACSLGGNNIGTPGGVALGKALQMNSSLQTLKYVVVAVELRMFVRLGR